MRKTAVDRFWSHVDKNGGPERLRWETIKDAPGDGTLCWIWCLRPDTHGYGRFYYHGRDYMRAHRYAWELINGPIPPEINVGHYCDHGLCVNPDHLYLGTRVDIGTYTSQKGHCMSELYPEKVVRGDNHPHRLHPENLPRGDNHPNRLHPENLRPAFGERSGQSKLNDQQVMEIRTLRAAGGITCQELADKFGVSDGTVRALCVEGRTWKHLPIIKPKPAPENPEPFKIVKGVPNIQRVRAERER